MVTNSGHFEVQVHTNIPVNPEIKEDDSEYISLTQEDADDMEGLTESYSYNLEYDNVDDLNKHAFHNVLNHLVEKLDISSDDLSVVEQAVAQVVVSDPNGDFIAYDSIDMLFRNVIDWEGGELTSHPATFIDLEAFGLQSEKPDLKVVADNDIAEPVVEKSEAPVMASRQSASYAGAGIEYDGSALREQFTLAAVPSSPDMSPEPTVQPSIMPSMKI